MARGEAAARRVEAALAPESPPQARALARFPGRGSPRPLLGGGGVLLTRCCPLPPGPCYEEGAAFEGFSLQISGGGAGSFFPLARSLLRRPSVWLAVVPPSQPLLSRPSSGNELSGRPKSSRRRSPAALPGRKTVGEAAVWFASLPTLSDRGF